MALRLRLVPTINWKYALGEFLLIFVGILAALGAAEWNSARLARAEERLVLLEMRSSLEADLVEFRATLERLRESEGRVERLVAHMHAGDPYTEDLDLLFGGAYGIIVSAISMAPYDALKSRGLNLIRDHALRLQIMDVYDRDYERLAGATELHVQINNILNRPYYLEHFRDLQFNERATPIDYAGMMETPYLLNLTEYRLRSLRANSIAVHEAAIEGATKLSQAIRAYLGD